MGPGMTASSDNPPDHYKAAGVDIAAGNALVKKIGPAAKASTRTGVMGGIGGFGGLFDLQACGYTDPVLVAGTDGVGTKLLLAQKTGLHGGIGQDLVAMCVNDIVVQGAEPLFFLDYAATGALDVDQMAEVIAGVAQACTASGCALIGGETAEMPGLYGPGHYDLAGFCVGAVERDRILTGATIADGDLIYGLKSSGVHSNGFSLVRRLLEASAIDLDAPAPGETRKSWAEALMEPTQLYVKACLDLHKAGLVTGLAHITGGGLLENIPRVLPNGLCAHIDAANWALPPLFAALAKMGGLSGRDLARTFNCGIGMAVIIRPGHADAVHQHCSAHGFEPVLLGTVAARIDAALCVVDDTSDTWGLGAPWRAVHEAEQ